MQVVLEVDVEPLAASRGGLGARHGDKGGSDATMPVGRGDDGVDQEGVGCTVPRHVDEADQVVFSLGAYPSKTVAVQSFCPVSVHGDRMPRRGGPPVGMSVGLCK